MHLCFIVIIKKYYVLQKGKAREVGFSLDFIRVLNCFKTEEYMRVYIWIFICTTNYFKGHLVIVFFIVNKCYVSRARYESSEKFSTSSFQRGRDIKFFPIVLSLLHRRNVAVKMPQSHALTYSAYYQLEDTPND